MADISRIVNTFQNTNKVTWFLWYQDVETRSDVMKKQLPLSNSWFPPRLRLKSFVRRHRDLLPFLGGLIISITLTTKEAIHDRYRGLADSIQSSQSFYRLERTTALSLEHLDVLGQVLTAHNDLYRNIVHEAGLFGDTELAGAFRSGGLLTQIGYRLRILDSSIGSNGRLVLSLGDSELSKKFETEKKTLKNLQESYEKEIALQAKPQSGEDLLRIVGDLWEKTRKLGSDADELNQTALDYGEAQIRNLERQDRVLKRSSYFLYTFGLVLTLTGKIFGTKDDDPDIE